MNILLPILTPNVPDDVVAQYLVRYCPEYAARTFLEYKEGKDISIRLSMIKQDREDKDGYTKGRGSPFFRTVPFSDLCPDKDMTGAITKDKKKFFIYIKEHLTCKEIRLVKLLMRGFSRKECANLIKSDRIKRGEQTQLRKRLMDEGMTWREADIEMSVNRKKYSQPVSLATISDMCNSIRHKLEIISELRWV